MSRPRLCKLACGCKYEAYGERECLISQCAEHEREYQERHQRATQDHKQREAQRQEAPCAI